MLIPSPRPSGPTERVSARWFLRATCYVAVMTVPVNIIAGFLGVGKTTAILNAFQHRPEHEKWAVLVNEFGDVGLDGATLNAQEGYVVKEIAGGCVCCTAGPLLKISLVRLLREEKPDRVFIEPTGLAHPASIIDMLRSAGLRDAVSLRALIGLVNPTHFGLARYRQHETYQDQLQMADVLVANHWDTASVKDRNDFMAAATGWFPPKLGVFATEMGHLDPKWLEFESEVNTLQKNIHHGHPDPIERDPIHPGAPRVEHSLDKVTTCGWVFPTEYVFDRLALLDVLQELVRPGDLLNQGALRIKGIFRTPRVWLNINGTPDTLNIEGINYRRDSRLDIIVDDEAPDWNVIEKRVLETVCAGL